MASLDAIQNIVGRPHDPEIVGKILSVVIDDMKQHCKREEAAALDGGLGNGVIAELMREHEFVITVYKTVSDEIKERAHDGCDVAALVAWLKELTVAHIDGVDEPIFRKCRYLW